MNKLRANKMLAIVKNSICLFGDEAVGQQYVVEKQLFPDTAIIDNELKCLDNITSLTTDSMNDGNSHYYNTIDEWINGIEPYEFQVDNNIIIPDDNHFEVPIPVICKDELLSSKIDYQVIATGEILNVDSSSKLVVCNLEDKETKNIEVNALNILCADYANSSSCSYTEVEEIIETPPNSKKRKKESSPSLWSRNINKQKRASGKSYINRFGKLVKRKEPKDINCSMCRFRCSEVFNSFLRLEICSEYWNLGDTTRQKNYISSLVSELPVKRRRPRTNNKIAKNSGDSEYNLDNDSDSNVIIDNNEENQRAVSREYFLLNSNTEKKRVCQKFFCATLSITFPVVNNALKNCNDFGMYTGIDGRKGQVAWNKLPLEITNKVKNHIDLFPRVESHYCRRDSSKQYLSSDLNISTMYRLYCEQIKTENYMLSPEDQEIPDDFYTIDVSKKNLNFLELTPKYKKQLQISEAKKKDLMKLLKDGVIPPIYSNYYRSLKTYKNIVPLNLEETGETDDENY
ncbi:hypothetical protein ACI65C_006836 [Semiaphis heraclei]